MSEDTNKTVTEEEITSDNLFEGKKYIPSSQYSKSVEVFTANSIGFNGVEFKAVWETEGLKIPMVINNGEGNKPFYLRIPRDEVVKMFTDILDQLSHN